MTTKRFSILQQIKVFIKLNWKLAIAKSRAKKIDYLLKQLDVLKKKEKELQDKL